MAFCLIIPRTYKVTAISNACFCISSELMRGSFFKLASMCLVHLEASLIYMSFKKHQYGDDLFCFDVPLKQFETFGYRHYVVNKYYICVIFSVDDIWRKLLILSKCEFMHFCICLYVSICASFSESYSRSNKK